MWRCSPGSGRDCIRTPDLPRPLSRAHNGNSHLPPSVSRPAPSIPLPSHSLLSESLSICHTATTTTNIRRCLAFVGTTIIRVGTEKESAPLQTDSGRNIDPSFASLPSIPPRKKPQDSMSSRPLFAADKKASASRNYGRIRQLRRASCWPAQWHPPRLVLRLRFQRTSTLLGVVACDPIQSETRSSNRLSQFCPSPFSACTAVAELQNTP